MIFKKHLLVILIIISCSKETPTTAPEPQKPEVNTTINILGGSNNDIAQSVTSTSDGGYAILGYTHSNDGDITGKTDTSFDYYLLKFTAEHQLQWQRTYGGTNDDRGKRIIQTQDNGYAIIGYAKSADGTITSNAGGNDFWLAKLNNSGDLQWQKSFGYSGKDDGLVLIETTDGFVIAGELDVTASAGLGNSKIASKHAGGDFWVIKLDHSGNTQWSRYYGGTFTDTPNGIVQTSDNSYIIIGTSDSNDVDISNNKGTYDIWCIKIDSSGELLWDKNFGGSEIDQASAITQTLDGHFLIIGDTRSIDTDITQNNGNADLWLLKITTNGELIWEKTIGGSNFDTGNSIKPLVNGGYIISGSSRSSNDDFTNQGQNDAWILKITEDGTVKWQEFYGGSNIDFLYDAVQLNDGSYVAVGESSSSDIDIPENKGFTDILIITIQE